MRNAVPVPVELLFGDEQQTTTPRATKTGWSTAALAFAISLLALSVSLVALSQVKATPASTNRLVEAVIHTRCETGTYLAGWNSVGAPQCRRPLTPLTADRQPPAFDQAITRAQEEMVIQVTRPG